MRRRSCSLSRGACASPSPPRALPAPAAMRCDCERGAAAAAAAPGCGCGCGGRASYHCCLSPSLSSSCCRTMKMRSCCCLKDSDAAAPWAPWAPAGLLCAPPPPRQARGAGRRRQQSAGAAAGWPAAVCGRGGQRRRGLQRLGSTRTSTCPASGSAGTRDSRRPRFPGRRSHAPGREGAAAGSRQPCVAATRAGMTHHAQLRSLGAVGIELRLPVLALLPSAGLHGLPATAAH